MGYYRTYVEHVGTWSSVARAPDSVYRRPATVVCHHGDGSLSLYKFMGKRSEALAELASSERLIAGGGPYVAFADGNSYRVEHAPDDFWIELKDESGEVTDMAPDLKKYPNAIAW